MPFIPTLHVLQEELDRLSRQGYDVHTFNITLYDGSCWQVRVEATDDDLEDHTFLYELDLHGWNIRETERHYA